MAAEKKSSRKKQPPFKDRTIFYSDLSYIQPQFKNEAWAAQIIYFAKKNARLFLDPKRAQDYRELDRLKLKEGEYRRMFDPVTPMGSGGTAEYVASDWKANPIYIHLKNVVKAEIQRTSKELEVNLTDKFAKTRKMKDNYKIFYSRLMREIINSVNKEIGKQPLSENQDPFKYIASQQAKGDDTKGDDIKPSDLVSNYNDLIKNRIQDDQDLALYNELIYKGDYEIGFEKGIQYYLMNLNKWHARWSDEFIDDIMHFNKAAGEWYTDLVTGRPVVERFAPEKLWVSPFNRKDGEDLMYYFIEYEITFGDFVKTIGANLEPQKLKDVFEYNKTQGSSHGFSWIELDGRENKYRDDAMIRVGKCAVLTQDYDVDLDEYKANIYPQGQQSGLDWMTGADKKVKMPQSTKHYNVWYSFYYIPPTTNSLSNADYAWQAQFIFDIKKNQDQLRFGEDGRYSKSPLVIYDNSKQASFTDIVQAYMPKINFAWMQYQNCLVNDIEAQILTDELVGGLLQAVDEDNKISTGLRDIPTGGNGKDAYMEQWKMIKQRGTGFLKMTDSQGNRILDPSTLQLALKNGQLERAEKYMGEIMRMYSMLTLSLAMTDAREGQDIKPRTSVAAIEESLKASNNATWFIQKAYEEFLKMYAERMVRFIIEIMKEAKEYGYTKRRDEFFDVIGVAYGLTVEGMEDVPPESVGLTINYIDNTAKKDYIMQLALERVKNGTLDDDFIYLLMGADNWKQSFCLMRMGINKRKQEQAHKEELEHERAMQLEQERRKTAMAMQGQKVQGEIAKIDEKGNIEKMLLELSTQMKTMSQGTIVEQRKNNKLEQDNNKLRLELERMQAEKETNVVAP